MERLSFGSQSRYDALEAAIHVARYGSVRTLCQGRSVLDIACGEGYGARLLSEWGASAVCAADISAEAIGRAQQMFAQPGIEFVQLDHEPLSKALGERRFDLVVCLETIEHVPDAPFFLRQLRERLAPGGTLVVSCPNDWWYFPGQKESNPFHRRKYTFEEFRALAETELGAADAWYLGSGMRGYCNVALARVPALEAEAPQERLLDARPISALIVPPQAGAAPTVRDASYFLGVWGGAQDGVESAAMMPLGMDAFAAGLGPSRGEDAATVQARLLADLRAVEVALRALSETRIARLSAGLRAQVSDAAGQQAAMLADALVRENRLLRERIEQLDAASSATEALRRELSGAGEREAVLGAQLEQANRLHRLAQDNLERLDTRTLLIERERVRLAEQMSRLKDIERERDLELEAARGMLAERNDQIEAARGMLAERNDQIAAARGMLAERNDRIAAVQEQLVAIEAECNALRLPAHRYLRLRRLVPGWVRLWALRVFRFLRRR